MEEKNSLLKTKEKLNHRLTLRKHFAYIYKKGKRYSSKYFTLYVIKSKFENYKIGFSINKKMGKANKRNLLKRRLREITRLADYIKPYYNYILLTRESAKDLDFNDLKNQVEYVFKKTELE